MINICDTYDDNDDNDDDDNDDDDDDEDGKKNTCYLKLKNSPNFGLEPVVTRGTTIH